MKGKSIFIKQLILYMGTLFTSFLLLGFMITTVYTKYYLKEMEGSLITQGKKVSKEYVEAYFTGDFSKLGYELQALEHYMGASVFFINRDGVLVKASSGIQEKWIGQAITNKEAIEGILNGNIVTMEGRINGMFEESVLTVGYPLQVGQMAGIFMCTSMPEIERSLHMVYMVVFCSLMIVMTIGIFFVYLFSKKITMPLLQMNEAAKIIAGGNFEQRVDIKSEDEIGQLAESFNHMAESLDEYEIVRRNFIASISHDLRSPLTSIQGFLNAILDGTIPAEKEEHYLNIILEETYRLTKLTNDVVELSKAQSSSVSLENTEFDINRLIRESLDSLEPRFLEKNIQVDAVFDGQETFVFADRDKISRVFYNLVDNAIKFSDSNSTIEIETSLKEKRKVWVHVKDHGRGISKEQQRYIFDRFYKADSSRGQDKAGSGLGLSIVRELILAQGETIDVRSEEEKGTEFIFSLKLAETDTES